MPHSPRRAALVACWVAGAGLVLGALQPGLSRAAPRQDGRALGSFRLTFYYVPEQREHGRWPVYGPACREVLVLASREFHDALSLEGVGRALDGRLLNFEERCSCALPGPSGTPACYTVLRQQDYPWGRGALWRGRYLGLQPFRSLAIDPSRVPIGAVVYLPELAGLSLPYGKTSTGCFRAEDTGSGISREHVDLFVGRPAWYRWAQRTLPPRVTVISGSKRCARLVQRARPQLPPANAAPGRIAARRGGSGAADPR